MRHRTKTHLLTQEEVEKLFIRAEVGHIGSFGKDGYPYIVPMHFVWHNQKIYLHGYDLNIKSIFVIRLKRDYIQIRQL